MRTRVVQLGETAESVASGVTGIVQVADQGETNANATLHDKFDFGGLDGYEPILAERSEKWVCQVRKSLPSRPRAHSGTR